MLLTCEETATAIIQPHLRPGLIQYLWKMVKRNIYIEKSDIKKIVQSKNHQATGS